jgi:hypothetical protein
MALQLAQYVAQLYDSLLRLLQEMACFQDGIVIQIMSIEQGPKATTADLNPDTIRLQNNVLTVILEFADGSFRTIDRPDSLPEPSSDRLRSESSGTRLEYHTVVYGRFSLEKDERIVQPLDGAQYQDKKMQSKAIRKDCNLVAAVLDTLYFRALSERVGIVSDPHHSTFDWIFEDKTLQQSSWSNFANWLKCDSGCYWINGKAGSGNRHWLSIFGNILGYARASKNGRHLIIYLWHRSSSGELVSLYSRRKKVCSGPYCLQFSNNGQT